MLRNGHTSPQDGAGNPVQTVPIHPGPALPLSNPTAPVPPGNGPQPSSPYAYAEGELVAPVSTVENQGRQESDVANSRDLLFSPDNYNARTLASVSNRHSDENARNRAVNVQQHLTQ